MSHWYNNNQHVDSYQAGFSFGKLFYNGYPNLAREKLYQKMRSLKVSKRFHLSVYYQGFELGYLTMTGNRLPQLKEVEQEQERQNIMGTISKAEQRVQESMPQTPFVKARTLAETNIPFCIQNVREVKGYKEGTRQWALDIIVADDFLYETQANEDGGCTLTLSMDDGQRDALMHEIETELPVHGVCMQVVKTKSGNTYFKFADVEGDIPCPCKTNGMKKPVDIDELEDDEEEEDYKAFLAAKAAKREKSKKTAFDAIGDDKPF